MRLAVVLGSVAVVVTGCVGPHSTGALWAQQNLEQEGREFTLPDSVRASRAHDFEVQLVDEALAGERARIDGELRACPGPTRLLAVSAGDRVRDGLRVKLQQDPSRLTALGQVALADWRVRRAAATGNPQFCDAARAALASAPAPAQTTSVLNELPVATVSRSTGETAAPGQAPTAGQQLAEGQARIAAPGSSTLETVDAGVALSNYALGYVDAVQAPAPLPQYLAAVYGGYLSPDATATNTLSDQAAAEMVDQIAEQLPQWEPDALYAALRGGRP